MVKKRRQKKHTGKRREKALEAVKEGSGIHTKGEGWRREERWRRGREEEEVMEMAKDESGSNIKGEGW